MILSPQASYLYHGVWSPATDTIILDKMIMLKKVTRWTETTFPSWFLMTAAQELQTTVDIVVSEEELAKRMVLMHRRYRVFKAVVVTFRAQWDKANKIVVASDDLWEKIMKYDWFMGAYYHNEEPEYTKLACLFGLTNIKVEREKEIIVLSDKTEKLPSDKPYTYEIGEVNEEVNSPAVFPPPTVCRKLFGDAPGPTDRESTTNLGIYFIDLASDGQLRTRFEKGRALPAPYAMKPVGKVVNQGDVGPSGMSPRTSSCGSNSPTGW